VGTKDLRRIGNLDYVMGDVYDLVNTAKTNLSTSRVVLSSAMRRRDVSRRRTGAVNNRYEWVAQTLGVTFVDPNSWIYKSRNGPHIHRRGARHLGQLYSRVCGIGGRRQKMRSELQCLAVRTSSKGTYEETGIKTIQEHLTSAWKTAESDMETTDTARRETEDETKEEYLAATVEFCCK